MTSRIALSTGTIEYADTGGESPAIVLLPGLMMNDPRRAGAGAGARTPGGRARAGGPTVRVEEVASAPPRRL